MPIRAISTPQSPDTVTLARISREHPPAIPIPAIATAVGCPASPADMPITATKKKPKEPRAGIAAPLNVRTAMIVTPRGVSRSGPTFRIADEGESSGSFELQANGVPMLTAMKTENSAMLLFRFGYHYHLASISKSPRSRMPVTVS
jgi:hypothetical protein